MGDAFISAIANRLITEIVNEVGKEMNLVWGVDDEVCNLATELEAVTNILDDAHKQAFTNQSTKGWLKRLEKACYEMDDVFDEWKYALHQQKIASKHKVCGIIPPPSSCLSFKKVSGRHRIAKKIEQVKKQLGQILEEKAKYNLLPNRPPDKVWRVSTSFVKEVDIYGRGNDKEIIMNKILDDEGVSREKSTLKVISLVGCGGIGKTTLAQLIYNDSRVVACYPMKIWICVSEPFDTETIIKRILENTHGGNPPATNLQSLLEHLKISIEGKKFLLVLDDVWNEDSSKWEPLKTCLEYGGMGSKIVVTTRKEDVGRKMGSRKDDIHQIGVLSDEDCWLVLSSIALPELSETELERFKKIGMEIAVKCKGLPLAAKTLGSLLLQKGVSLNEWDNVAKSDMWKLEQAEIDLFPHLALSYNELSPALKRCFSYCAIFPKDHKIDVDELIRIWLAQGYLGAEGELECKGREYFNILAMHSLFHEFEVDDYEDSSMIVSCKMHDIIHDFATFLRKNQNSGIVKGSSCRNCSPLIASCVQDYRSLVPWHNLPPIICDCLANVKVWYYSPRKGLEKLIHLRYLHLEGNRGIAEELIIICRLYNLETLVLRSCSIRDIPEEIGNLIGLRYLDLSWNDMKVLPESVCDLEELRSLNIEGCKSLCGLPKGFNNLKNFKHLYIDNYARRNFPDEVIGQLSGLHTLRWFQGRLSYLQNLDQLRGSLLVNIEGDMRVEEDVVKAKGAQLNKKEFLNSLLIRFPFILLDATRDIGLKTLEEKEIIIKNAEDVLDDLKPHPNLTHLEMWGFEGSKLSNWISLPFNNHLKSIVLYQFWYLTSLPPLGRLPCLELLQLQMVQEFKFVGREFLGITIVSASVGSSSSAVGFPKLKKLQIECCDGWEEWEDITIEEETSTTLSLFPCLQILSIEDCPNIQALPHRLLHKAPALRNVYLHGTGVEKKDVIRHCGYDSGVTYHWEE